MDLFFLILYNAEDRNNYLSDARDPNGASGADEPEDTMAKLAKFIEQLHANKSSPIEKESITDRLLRIARSRKEARALIGSHTQAMPLLLSVLRNGTAGAKLNVAGIMTALCKDEDLRLKVLLGGCIPPLLSLLKSQSTEARKAAAEAIFAVSSAGLSDDHVGMKIFIMEGVVPTLWDQLNPKKKEEKVIEGFLTGALRNICCEKEGYQRATLEAERADIIMCLLSSENTASQSNAASLLARLVLSFNESIPHVIDSGAVKDLLRLVGQKNDPSVRSSAADALQALSSKSTKAKRAVVDAGGIPVLIRAVVAPSKECMVGNHGQALQRHATQALENICGGLSDLILYLGELSQSSRLDAPVADIIGALAYALMIFEQGSDAGQKSFDATKIENILIALLRPRDSQLIQERVLEAMASLYGNNHLTVGLSHTEAKRVLIGLITMALSEVQEHLIHSLTSLCGSASGIWDAVEKREGIQLLISLLGLSGEQHQEYAVELLAILTHQVDESKWAITAAGGIPPLVQLLETGSQKAREDAANVLWELCCHSEDIRACVESAGAVPALLWLLRSGGQKGQEASALALTKLIRTADAASINQLLTLLLGDFPSSKTHVIRVLGHILTMASNKDLLLKGSAANRGLKSLVDALDSSNEETQENAASVVADFFSVRHDICDSLAIDEIAPLCVKLLTSNREVVAKQSARALGALSRPSKNRVVSKVRFITAGDLKPLIKLAKNSSFDGAETAVGTLANLLCDPQIAEEALAEDVISALTRVLVDGSSEGKKNASRALYQLLRHFPLADVLTGNAQYRFAVLALVDSLNDIGMDTSDAANVLEVVAILARTKPGVSFSYPQCSALADVSSNLEPLVRCLDEGPSPVQDKAIEILSRFSGDQPVILRDLLIARSRSIGSLANRIVNSSILEVRVGGAALLICALKDHKQLSMDALDQSGYLKPLILSLVDMVKSNSSCPSLEIEVQTPRGFKERTPIHEGDEFVVADTATVLGGTVALWSLSIISSFHSKNRLTVVEGGGLEAIANKFSIYASNPQVRLIISVSYPYAFD